VLRQRGESDLSENFLETIGCLTAKAPRHSPQQIEIHGTLRALESRSGIRQVLPTARKAFHRNEVFSTHDVQIDVIKSPARTATRSRNSTERSDTRPLIILLNVGWGMPSFRAAATCVPPK
jgi:hypothetical protein